MSSSTRYGKTQMSTSSGTNVGPTGKRGVRARGRARQAFALLLALLGVGVFIYLFLASRADDERHVAAGAVSKEFKRALEDDRIAEAYRLTTQSFQEKLSLEKFRELIERYPALKGRGEKSRSGYHGKVYEYHGKVQHDFGSLQFTYEVQITNHGQTASFSYVIVREDGSWRVNALNFRQ
jgi:hypothetical protein